MVEFTDFDEAELLDSPEAIAAFLSDTFREGEPDDIIRALATAASAKGNEGR